jgi:methionine-S-sulfoxide reductase
MKLFAIFLFACNLCVAQNNSDMKQLTLGGGCFWCIEAAFEDAVGVSSVVSGFSGGVIKNPAYREVVSGTTGHAEVCQITYDPSLISLLNLLEIFFLSHDPTTLNRQGNDVGTHYRSIILYHYEDEFSVISDIIANYNNDYFDGKIVTEVMKFEAFYMAEDYHQEYFKNNSDQPYCQIVIAPKLSKVREKLSKYY